MDNQGDFFAGLEEARRQAERVARVGGEEHVWRLLSEITELMSSPIDRFDAVIEAVLETIVRLTGADRGFLMMLEEEGAERGALGFGPRGDEGVDRVLVPVPGRGTLRVCCERNVEFESLPEQARRVSRSIVEEVLRSERGIAIADLGEVDRFGDAASIQELRLLSVMCVPLLLTVRDAGVARSAAGLENRRRAEAARAQRVIGVIYVDSRSVTTSFGEQDLALFQALANVASTAIVQADTFRRATTDRLTGLLTRRRARALVVEALRVARKHGEPLSVLLADIDGLKRINQERGYAAGDEALVRVAQAIREKTRRLDFAARWGAEEFLVVLPTTDAAGAQEVARKLLLRTQELDVNLSIGVAACKGREESVDALIGRADQALSLAKQEGGARVRSSTSALARKTPPKIDKLAGVFGGDAGTVYRNVLLLLEGLPALHSGGSVERVLARVVEQVLDLARAERGFVFLRESDGKPQARIGRDRSGARVEPERLRMPLVEEVLRRGEPVQTRASATLGPVISAPLQARGAAALGAIYVEGAPGVEFPEGTLAFLTEFAHQAAIALDNARLLSENVEKARKIEKLMHALEEERTRSLRRLETTAQLVRDDSVVADNRRELETRYRYDNIVGRSSAMRRVFRMLDKVTASTVPVFIHGESGTGKELVAKAIHFNGPRRSRPFIAENCGAVTESLLESELFGYVRGAFTGATTDKKGLFELANGGTILLDEVGEMTPNMQTKLLRVLQEGEIRRVGGKETIKVDVRVISASNRDIRKMVEEGTFREDLFYRLNVVRIDLPPLRERQGDVPLLVEHMLEQAAAAGEPRREMSPEALDILCRHTWPGNVRELANVIERALILAEGPVIGPEAILLDSASPELQRELSEASGGSVGFASASSGGESTVDLVSSIPQAVQPGHPLAQTYYRLNERQRRLIDYLRMYGTIKNRDYYEIMGVSKSTGWRDLKDLMDRGLIRVKGKGKGSLYSLTPSVQEALAGER